MKSYGKLSIIDGELTAYWKEGGQTREQVVRAGDLIESEDTPHTFTNHTDKTVRFLVIKQALNGENHREVFKSDKVLDEGNETKA